MSTRTRLVFPAGAGMNRMRPRPRRYRNGVPRRRGDEPAAVAAELADLVCSPQARG